MYIADTLSRACASAPVKGNKILIQINAIQNSDLNPTDHHEMQIATAADTTMQTLLTTVKSGWPDNKDAQYCV